MRRFLPLAGVRVVTFETAFSLPSGTRTLAELGAEVVRVGRPGRDNTYIDWVDGSAFAKALVSIDLKNEHGIALARELATAADVVSNNFRPGVMKRYGLDYPSLQAARPDIIVLQLSGYGGPGPWADFGAFGPGVEAAAGMWTLTGEEGDPPIPVGSGVYADQVGGRFAALAIVAALARRRATGAGQYIDLSMTEGIAHLLGDELLVAAAAGAAPGRRGNRSASAAPQGVYPCRGDDQWLALSIFTEAQWRALREVVGDERLSDPALCVHAERHRRHDEIDEVIARWSRLRDKHEAAELLQARRIPAGPVQRTSDLLSDPQYAARGTFELMRHAAPILGYAAHPSMVGAWLVEGRRRAVSTGRGPGADNARILRRWLGLSSVRVHELERNGALLPPQPIAVAEPRRLGANAGTRDPEFAAKLGLPDADPVVPA